MAPAVRSEAMEVMFAWTWPVQWAMMHATWHGRRDECLDKKAIQAALHSTFFPSACRRIVIFLQHGSCERSWQLVRRLFIASICCAWLFCFSDPRFCAELHCSRPENLRSEEQLSVAMNGLNSGQTGEKGLLKAFNISVNQLMGK